MSLSTFCVTAAGRLCIHRGGNSHWSGSSFSDPLQEGEDNVLTMALYRSPADTVSQSLCSMLQHSVSAPLMSPLCSVQEVLGDETADQVCCSFFGDGTCNVGESPSWSKLLTLARVLTSIPQN